MTKRIAAATGIIAAVIMLTACGTGDWDNTHESDLTTQVITVDGREVTCVTYPIGYVGGIDCDWEGAR